MSQTNEPIIPHLGLLILDVQDSFLKVIPDSKTFTRRVQFCLEVAQLFGLPILFTEQRPDVLGGTRDEVLDLAPSATRIAKTGFSAFSEPAVSEWTQTNDLDHLLITGLETPICVYQSVLDAIGENLAVTVFSDAVSCRRTEDSAFVFEAFKAQDVHVLPSETVFYSILRDSKHPSFKEFTGLVKKYSDS